MQYAFHLSLRKVSLLQPTYWPTFAFVSENVIHYHMSSFNETTGLGLLKTDPIEFVKYPPFGMLLPVLENAERRVISGFQRTFRRLFVASNWKRKTPLFYVKRVDFFLLEARMAAFYNVVVLFLNF